MKKSQNWIVYIILGMVIAIIVSVIMIIINNNSDKDADNIQKKVEDEFKYLSKSTLAMINQLNNLKTTDEIQIKRSTVGTSSQNVTTSQQETSGSSGKNEETDSSSSSSNEQSGSNSGDNKMQNMEKYYIKNDSVLLRKNDEIDWDDLQEQAENLYSSWTTITLDLNSMNVPSDLILSYNKNLDNLIVSIQEKNKVNTTICLANLYSLIPEYMNATLNDATKLKVENIKSNVIYAYSLVETSKWDEILNFLSKAEADITELINSANNFSEIKQSKINKAYVLLKELIKSSNDQNVDLFYFKYINLIQELDNI